MKMDTKAGDVLIMKKITNNYFLPLSKIERITHKNFKSTIWNLTHFFLIIDNS
jgi:hypothetical protein